MAKPKLISTVFHCTGCGHKGTYGAEHAGPLPISCPMCDEPWTGTERHEGEPTPDRPSRVRPVKPVIP